ncbi:MAG: serine/threonine-protein kinase, partial [Planctomycetota bacterium]
MSHPESDSGFERPSRAFDEIVAKYLALRHEDDDIDLTEYLASVPAELRPECRETILAALAFEELEPRARPSGGGAGRVVADYRLIREIGRGGMGVVYEAEQISLGRRVALKLLPSGLLATSRQVERFRREAAAVAKLRHPGIVPIYTTGELDGIHFFAMELVEGISLDREIESRRAEQDEDPREARDDTPSPTARISEIVARVAEALQYSHDQGIIHRDVKPHNILLDRSGLPRLVDFGLAKDDEAGSLSVSGDLVGTVHYMSPEQLLAKSHLVDHRTDVYSLGVVLYELLTLQLPFQGRSAQEILVKINTREPKSIRKLNPRVARDLETICSKAMSKDPNGRYATAGELAADLRRFLRLEPIQAKPPGRLERTLKWARREPARALAAALAALLLLGTPTAIAIVLEIARQEAVSERNEKDRALADAKRSAEAATLASLEAQKQAARYIAIDDFVNRFLFSVAPGNHGERITMLEVIDEAARELEANPPDALDVEVELRRKLGTTYSLLGRYPEALDQLDKGLSGVATLPEELDPLRAELHYQRGRVLDRTNRGREAIESFSRALALHQKYAEGDTGEIAAIKSNIVLIEG